MKYSWWIYRKNTLMYSRAASVLHFTCAWRCFVFSHLCARLGLPLCDICVLNIYTDLSRFVYKWLLVFMSVPSRVTWDLEVSWFSTCIMCVCMHAHMWPIHLGVCLCLFSVFVSVFLNMCVCSRVCRFCVWLCMCVSNSLTVGVLMNVFQCIWDPSGGVTWRRWFIQTVPAVKY